MTTDTVKQGCIKHAAMAQLHRWYQIYENVDTTLANQLDILASDIKLKSGLGEGVGHEAYSQRINQLPKTWKNAHLVNGSNFKLSADGTIDLDITLTYLNQGMKPDGSIRSAELTYTTKLRPTANVLPQFSQIEIKQLNEGVAPAFKDAYPENRVLSLMHYWLALIEDPKRNLGPFKEILADGFELQFSSDKINDFQAFEKWFRGPASAVAASTHVIDNFSYEVIDKKPDVYKPISHGRAYCQMVRKWSQRRGIAGTSSIIHKKDLPASKPPRLKCSSHSNRKNSARFSLNSFSGDIAEEHYC